jgi:hypothetical protein
MSDYYKEVLRIAAILNSRDYKIVDVVKDTGLTYSTLNRVRNYKKGEVDYLPSPRTIAVLSKYFKA